MRAVSLVIFLAGVAVFGTSKFHSLEERLRRILKETQDLDMLERGIKTLDVRTEDEKKDCGVQADIALILDCSSSIKPDDYGTMKKFVKNLIKAFEIGQDKVRLAIISFNKKVSLDLYLDGANDVATAVKAVNKILDTGVGTNTHKALTTARTSVFLPAIGDRPDIPNIAIVLTDGRSTSSLETRKEAKRLKVTGVTVFSIGVGKWLSDQELQFIASKPSSEFSFRVDNFDGLDAIFDTLTKRTCKSIVEPPGPIKECDPYFDIGFILDASSSIAAEDFETMKQFIDNFISSFEISPEATRVAVSTFNAFSKIAFNFDDFSSYHPMKKAIMKLEQGPSGTATHKALNLANREMFSLERKDMPPAPKIAVLLTDGRSMHPDQTVTEASLLKLDGVSIFAIGVGKTRITELHDVASDPPARYNLNVEQFDDLKVIFSEMVNTTCTDLGTDSGDGDSGGNNGGAVSDFNIGVYQDCEGQADMVFFVEIPESDDDFEMVRSYLQEVVRHIVIAEDKVKVAITLFAKNAFPISTLKECSTREDIIAALGEFKTPRKRRTDHRLFLTAMKTGLDWRAHSAKITVTILMDSPSKTKRPDLLKSFKKMKNQSITSFVINVGSNPWEEGVNALASEPQSLHAMFVPRMNALINTAIPLITRACDAMVIQEE